MTMKGPFRMQATEERLDTDYDITMVDAKDRVAKREDIRLISEPQIIFYRSGSKGLTEGINAAAEKLGIRGMSFDKKHYGVIVSREQYEDGQGKYMGAVTFCEITLKGIEKMLGKNTNHLEQLTAAEREQLTVLTAAQSI